MTVAAAAATTIVATAAVVVVAVDVSVIRAAGILWVVVVK